MASLKDIRSRISSTKSTQKITSALKLVSASKLRKAQTNVTNLRPYANGLRHLIFNLIRSGMAKNELFGTAENSKKVLVIVMASDRGLCGSFNSSINKFTENYYKENNANLEVLDFIFIGKKLNEYFKPREITALETVTDLVKEISYTKAADIANATLKRFKEDGYDEVKVIYNEFQSAIAQEVRCETLLPIDPNTESTEVSDKYSFGPKKFIEPDANVIVEQLIDKYFTTQVYRCLSESVASEHGSRMTAMENASKNAGEMINDLTLTYNKLRQAQITTELTEITSGAEALN